MCQDVDSHTYTDTHKVGFWPPPVWRALLGARLCKPARQQTTEQRDKTSPRQNSTTPIIWVMEVGYPNNNINGFALVRFLGSLGRGSSYSGHKYAATVTATIFLNIFKLFGELPLHQAIDMSPQPMHWVSRQWRNELSTLFFMLKERVTLPRNILPDKTRHSSCISLWQIAPSQIYMKIQVFFVILGKYRQHGFFANVPSHSNRPPKSHGSVSFLPGWAHI